MKLVPIYGLKVIFQKKDIENQWNKYLSWDVRERTEYMQRKQKEEDSKGKNRNKRAKSKGKAKSW